MKTTDHLERHLGLIEKGWSTDAFDRKAPFAVVRLPGGPLGDRKVFATVGLSDHALASKRSSKTIRQELIFIAPASFGDRSIPGLMQQVGMDVLKAHSALLRGEILGPRGRLFETGKMEALYVSIPVCLPESFEAFTRDDGETVIMAWLVPVSGVEATLIKQRGWEAFEDELVKHDPDLSDPERPSLLIAATSGS